MDKAKINELKAIASVAEKSYNTEQARLVDAGFKSAQRYILLKVLKAEADATAAVYRKFANSQIMRELDKMIAEDRPAREAAARARSPWKQAKFDAAKA